MRKLADGRIALFRRDPFDPRLETHRLRGKLKKLWSFSVDQRYRILFEFLDKSKTEVVFLDVGTHSIDISLKQRSMSGFYVFAKALGVGHTDPSLKHPEPVLQADTR